MMAASGKWLAWASIAMGILTALTPVLPAGLVREPYSTLQLAWFVLMGIAGTSAGFEALGRRRRGFLGLVAVYGVQLVSYSSERFSFDLMSPISLALGFGFQDPPRLLSLNVVALVACVLALNNARRLAARSAAS